MNEKFKEYVAKGFDFTMTWAGIPRDLYIEVEWTIDDFDGERVIHKGNNLDHAFAAADLWLEGSE